MSANHPIPVIRLPIRMGTKCQNLTTRWIVPGPLRGSKRF